MNKFHNHRERFYGNRFRKLIGLIKSHNFVLVMELKKHQIGEIVNLTS